ncbi:MAG: hypothetical protein J7484_09535 [Microbacterium sp.]|nr:hypothetical protein [Microbacterium sp.]
MRVTLHEVDKGRALPTTSLEFHTGAVRYALAETEQRPTVLGLIASGRMRPDSGRVTIDGAVNAGLLRRTIALVDAPDVSDPHADITLAGVVGEELMFAGRRATPLHARRWLNEIGFGELAGVPIGNVDPAARVRILCELAVLREGTRGIVLVSPDRHGGSPDGWWRIASEFADRGYAMLVILGGSAAVALERMQEIDAVNASGPIQPLVLDTDAETGTDSETGTDAETAADAETGTDASPRTGAEYETDADPSTDADPGTDGVSGSDIDPEPTSDLTRLHDDDTDARPETDPSPGTRDGIVHPSRGTEAETGPDPAPDTEPGTTSEDAVDDTDATSDPTDTTTEKGADR